MQRFAILDDENEFLLKIKNIFNKYKNFKLDLYLDPYDLIEVIDRYDVIFIDYEMPVMNAFDFFEKTKNNHYIKIVITNYDQMIFDSLKYNIFYFVRKNNLEADLQVCMEKLFKLFDHDQNNKLIIQSYNHIISLYYQDIKYLETKKNYIVIHALKEYKIRCTFKKILSLIDYKNFIVISYGVIVNIEYIQHIDFKNMLVIMNDGLTLSLSKKYKESVKNKYREYKLL